LISFLASEQRFRLHRWRFRATLLQRPNADHSVNRELAGGNFRVQSQALVFPQPLAQETVELDVACRVHLGEERLPPAAGAG
jgi:hypothetical protein